MNIEEINEIIGSIEFLAIIIDSCKESGKEKKELINFYAELIRIKEAIED